MIADHNKQWSIKKKFEELIKSVQKRAEQENKYIALFIDEMPLSFFEECKEYNGFFQYLHAKYPLVHVFMAISPSGRNLAEPIDIQLEDNDKIFAKQLRSRHRNSILLSSLLIHLTYYYNKLKQNDTKFKCLSPSKDIQLDPSKLPDGQVTLWYHQSSDISDLEILEFLDSTYFPERDQVLVSPCQQNLSQSVYDWCFEKKWEMVSHSNMTGSERDLVIAFADDNFGNLEIMERARKMLIIVTR